MKLGQILNKFTDNYWIIISAVILFFLAKALIGYLTFKHYNRKLKNIEDKLEELFRKEQKFNSSKPYDK
ncbi:hypothetical protein [Priestia endophytica]|jgi:hypothetical protein|uniref:hypothetical protein n=1 Tax=Priestia endophytica TaxID=135735 RepID=UPI000F522E20|nr:hypothetical protein [Priestia endophytica]RPK08279.1 hypothetical protein FH5_04909 [Priestia endophytica]